MKTKIVYVICSDEKDYYLEQVLMSIFSLRKHNSDAIVELVVDANTDSTLSGNRTEILKYVDSKIVVSVPKEYNKKESSRFIKTYLRHYLSGDFLYIDSDTIICDNLSDIDLFDGDLGAVFDLHEPNCLKLPNYTEWLNKVRQEGWTNSNAIPYFNSGVLFVRDTPRTHHFYEDWHLIWLKMLQDNGRYRDQEPFALANERHNYLIKELSGIWNCQILSSALPYLHKAKIIHYFFTSLRNKQYAYALCNRTYLIEIRKTGGITNEIASLLDNAKTAFVHPSYICGPNEINLLSGELAQVCTNHPRVKKTLDNIFRYMMKFYSFWRRRQL